MALAPNNYIGNALRPRARLLRTLGEELISNEIVAIIELVKNSYDADATRVLIRFVGPLEPSKGYIEVVDDGHGMELTTVQTVWMEPATPSKRGKIRRSDRFKRRYLGEKGIGRFASSRLAKDLEIITRPVGSAREIYGLFDWSQFEDENKYLDEVMILWEERKPTEIVAGGTIELLWENDKKSQIIESPNHGTILRMSGLKQKWEASQFEALRRGLARLISPKLSKDSQDDFLIELDLPEEFSQFSNKVESPPILRYPHYTIKGSIKSEGYFELTYGILAEGKSEAIKGQFLRVTDAQKAFKLRGLEEKPDEKDESPSEVRNLECGPIEIELRVWDRDELGNVVQKTHGTIQDIRRDLDAVAGINIYRDGFRVLPYGEPNDDWLRLDIRRVQNPTLRLSNNQIYGIVHISADHNDELRDQSNREGLDENQAFKDLREVIIRILSRLETMRYAARPRDSARSGKPVGGLFSGFDLKPFAAYIARRLPEDNEAKKLVESTEAAFGGQLKEIQVVLARYQRLATLGQLIDHVLHEGRQPITTINNEADFGLSDTRQLTNVDSELPARLKGRFGVIRKQGDILAIAFRRMEPFGGRRRGRPAQLYLEDIIRDAFAVFAEDIARLKVKTALPNTQTLVRIDPAEMQEVFINLIQNSIYWLEQTSDAKREIMVKVERKGPDQVDILFSDSGPGVPKENRALIFDPYFTTKPDGIGLGLSIVGEIVTDYYNGSVELLQRGPLKGFNLQISLRKRV